MLIKTNSYTTLKMMYLSEFIYCKKLKFLKHKKRNNEKLYRYRTKQEVG